MLILLAGLQAFNCNYLSLTVDCDNLGFDLNIKLIPVGLEFSNYSRVRQVLTVVYGKPIEVSEFYDLYRESPERALNELRARLSEKMKMNMVHIESEEDYEAIDELRSMINGKYSDDIRFPKLFRDRMLISKLNKLKSSDPPLYRKICDLSLSVRKQAKEINADYRLLEKKKHPLGWLIAGFIGLIVTFPLFIYGTVFNLIFLEIPNLQIKKIRDVQFHSSVRYGLSLALAFIFLPLIFFSPWWLALGIFLTIPLSGLFAWNYYLVFRRITGGFRIRNYLRRNNNDIITLKRNHSELLRLVKGL